MPALWWGGIVQDVALIASVGHLSVYPNYLIDKVAYNQSGPMNVMMPFTAAAGILTYAWPFAESQSSLIAVTVIYG